MSALLAEQIAQLEAAMAALEVQRATLGDATADTSIAILRAQIAILRMQASTMASTATRRVEAQLEHLRKADLIRLYTTEPELGYIFKHALTQQAAYDSMLHAVRREIHRSVARTYENLYANRLDTIAPVLLHHYAASGDDAKTVEYAIRAGDAAARVFAHAEARAHYAQALEILACLPPDEANRRTRVITILKQVSVGLLSDAPRQNLVRLTEAEALVEQLAQGKEMLRAQVYYWTGRLQLYLNDAREAMQAYRQLLAAAEHLQDERLVGTASAMMGRSLYAQGRFNLAIPHLSRAQASLAAEGNWPEWVIMASILANALAAQGDYAAALSERERALERAESLQDLTSIAAAHLLGAHVYLFGGDVTRTLEENALGRIAAENANNQVQVYMSLGIQAWAESRVGEHKRAAEFFAQTAAMLQQFGHVMLFADWFVSAQAEIALNAGRIDEALSLAEHAVQYAESLDGVFAAGIAHRVWGQALASLSGTQANALQFNAAQEQLAASALAFEEGEARLESARTHLVWGKLLSDRAETESARVHLEAAAAQFEASGLRAELAQARSLIANLH
jgi:tetratricopeptide (TPR) repeat protein